MLTQNKIQTIAKLNDTARAHWFDRSFCQTMLTEGVRALLADNADDIQELMLEVVNFNLFTEGNGPYGEHDFGSFSWGGAKLFWKIDYYDQAFQYLSEDPSNPLITGRVLTVMLTREY
ncbi:MAG: DUF3768 domain-containing protein [Methylobacter sp.]